MKINLYRSLIFFICALIFFIIPVNYSLAYENKKINIWLDESTIQKGYTVSAFNNDIKLSLIPGILSSSTQVEIVELNEKLDLPWNLNLISKVYQFEFKNKDAYDASNPFYIQVSYNTNFQLVNKHKQVFFYDRNFDSWRHLPTKDYEDNNFVRSRINLPFARIAVFEYPEVATEGSAGWYEGDVGNFASSPDFPKGSKLRIINSDNKKFVDVIVNDYKIDKHLFPGRVINLEKHLFSQISSIDNEFVDVKIEPLHIALSQGRLLGVMENGAKSIPEINSKSAIIINEDTQEILFEKNIRDLLPIASLTKLVSIKVFLDTQPTLNKVVEYSKEDEEKNYLYVEKPWRIAKLGLIDGDKITIEDLLYASLVGSANNAIETLVRVSKIGRDEFIARMNQYVNRLGANSTNFIEPTGLSTKNVSSVKDYAVITSEIYKNPIIQKTSTLNKYEFKLENRDKNFSITNTNKIILTNSFSIVGSKTGYLDEAGFCLMTRVEKYNKERIIVVLLGATTRSESFLEVEDLIKYGLFIDNKL